MTLRLATRTDYDATADQRRAARQAGRWMMPNGALGPRIVAGAPMPRCLVAALQARGLSDERVDKLRAKGGADVTQTPESIAEQAAAIARTADLGTPSARKTGRNPRWPYVPVVLVPTGVGDDRRQEQIRGLAYATRDEAIDTARREIEHRRAVLVRQLADPRYRALRQSYGLPREL